MGGGGSLLKTVLPIAASALGAYYLGPMIGSALAGEGAVATASQAAAGTAIGGAVGGLGGSVASGALGGGQPTINMPAPSTPSAMPTVGGSGTEQAQQATLTALRQRQGRAASILSQGGLDNTSGKLGG